jgi:hypothetical protein
VGFNVWYACDADTRAFVGTVKGWRVLDNAFNSPGPFSGKASVRSRLRLCANDTSGDVYCEFMTAFKVEDSPTGSWDEEDSQS